MNITTDVTYVTSVLRSGGIGIIPTDTIYGIVASVRNHNAVDRLYRVRRRAYDKPFLILISSIDEIASFDIVLSRKERAMLSAIWSGDAMITRNTLLDKNVHTYEDNRPISVVLDCDAHAYRHIHRGKNSIGFRIPRGNAVAMEIVGKVGPIVAPSANIAGETMINDIDHIMTTFGMDVDFYVPYTYVQQEAHASMIIALRHDEVTVVRQ